MPMVNGNYVAPNWVNDQAPAIDAAELNAISQTVEGLLLPKITITTEDPYTSMTATNGTDTITLTNNSGTWVGWFTDYGTWVVTAVASEGTAKAAVEVDTVKEYSAVLVPNLNSANWDVISAISQAGTAASYWEVGDTKSIVLNGTVGTLSLSNLSIQLFILGFDHNSAVEGTGIAFGGFKLSWSTNNVALIDEHYSSDSTDGSLRFNIEHWGSNNYGGWKGCDFRYDILGSTNVAPSGYGANAVAGRTGNDPSDYDIVTAPKANTLLAALPSDLRAVMKPMTKWTDNVAGGTGSVESNVTSSIEYLTLLSRFEVQGVSTYANTYEAAKQQQYEYFVAGNSKDFYRHSAPEYTCKWWLRSPSAALTNNFCFVGPVDIGRNYTRTSYGVVPALLV